MKYTSTIIIEVPIDTFVTILDNPENMKHWQRGLNSFEHVSGNPGSIGAKMKLNYAFGRRTMTLIETITENNLPHTLHMHYDAKGMHNIQENYFHETDEGYTKWVSKNEFVATSFLMRMMTVFMPKAFKKQSMQYLTDFKNFAEKGISVQNETA